jgi:porphobilinogen deaminase
LDGSDKVEIEISADMEDARRLGRKAAEELLEKGGAEIAENIRHATK